MLLFEAYKIFVIKIQIIDVRNLYSDLKIVTFERRSGCYVQLVAPRERVFQVELLCHLITDGSDERLIRNRQWNQRR